MAVVGQLVRIRCGIRGRRILHSCGHIGGDSPGTAPIAERGFPSRSYVTCWGWRLGRFSDAKRGRIPASSVVPGPAVCSTRRLSHHPSFREGAETIRLSDPPSGAAWWGRGGAQNALVEKYIVIDFFSGHSAKVDLPGHHGRPLASCDLSPLPLSQRSLAFLEDLQLRIELHLVRIRHHGVNGGPVRRRVGQREMAGTRSFQRNVVGALDDPYVIPFQRVCRRGRPWLRCGKMSTTIRSAGHPSLFVSHGTQGPFSCPYFRRPKCLADVKANR